jgi:DNA repair exonuclease SbcCD nuclease subunit
MHAFRFVHAADLHLDTPFAGLSRLGADVPELLRDASLQAFDNLVQLTLDAGAHALVLAGDIYDGPERGLRAQLRFHAGLQRLSDHGVQVVMVHGNHDPVAEGWSAIRDWPDLVTVMPAETVDSVPVRADGREVARVYGISYAKRETRENLAKRFPGKTDAPFAIGVLHCNAGGNAEHANYSPCELADLGAADIDYWALGHIHRHQTLADGAPWVVYPGVLQGRSPKPSEQGAKGAVVVDVADSRVQQVEFRPLDVVRFAAIELDIAGIVDIADLQRRLDADADQAVDAADGRQLVLRATLTGRGAVHAMLRASDRAVDDLLAALQEGASGRVWWDRLIDRTAPPVDPDAIRRRGDFAAELLHRADALAADGDAREAFLSRHASASDRRLKGIVGEADRDDDALLDAAVAEALDRLEPTDDE